MVAILGMVALGLVRHLLGDLPLAESAPLEVLPEEGYEQGVVGIAGAFLLLRAFSSGCAALTGVNRKHAILGVSDACIASYAGDFAQALIALGAGVRTTRPEGDRLIPFEQLHTGSDDPHRETVLAPDELITGFVVPAGPWTRRSLYVKVRDRESYAYGVATAAVALDLRGGVVREARIGLGAVSYKPWPAHEAEALLRGKPLDEALADAAGAAAFSGAVTRPDNAFKIELGRRTLVRALLQASRLEV